MWVSTEYLRQGDANVWMVDYPKLVSGTLCYTFAVHNIQHVGHCLAQLITALRRHSSADIHVVGFSLGAHVANYIANKLGGPKLDRITGLFLLFSYPLYIRLQLQFWLLFTRQIYHLSFSLTNTISFSVVSEK